MPTAKGQTALVVSDSTDVALRSALNQLRSSGYTVSLTPDVFSAMAKLAKGENFERVFVDTRHLSDSDCGFIKLAPRYFPAVEVEALGFDEKQTLKHAPIVESFPSETMPDRERVVSRELPSPELETGGGEPPVRPGGPEEGVRSGASSGAERPTPWTTLSTDGEVGSELSGPSLHEAVRSRMAGNDPRTVRRRPPSVKLPGSDAAEAGRLSPDGADRGNKEPTEGDEDTAAQ